MNNFCVAAQLYRLQYSTDEFTLLYPRSSVTEKRGNNVTRKMAEAVNNNYCHFVHIVFISILFYLGLDCMTFNITKTLNEFFIGDIGL